MIRRYIGLSLSFCIADILQNKIAVDDIAAIVTSTKFEDQHDAFEHYFISYWSQYADMDMCKAVLNQVWNLVNQPRMNFSTENHRGHSIGHGWWLDTYEGTMRRF